jgi:oxygen-independent coproporphyrinogen-3 oxidase
LKYWSRQPYFGFGVDAHSMLLSTTSENDAARFSPADSLEEYMSGAGMQRTAVSRQAALEESFFLGLRLNRGVNLCELAAKFGETAVDNAGVAIAELIEGGLLERVGDFVRLTSRGRLLSNEVFERFILAEGVAR